MYVRCFLGPCVLRRAAEARYSQQMHKVVVISPKSFSKKGHVLAPPATLNPEPIAQHRKSRKSLCRAKSRAVEVDFKPTGACGGLGSGCIECVDYNSVELVKYVTLNPKPLNLENNLKGKRWRLLVAAVDIGVPGCGKGLGRV